MYKHYPRVAAKVVDGLLALHDTLSFRDSYGHRCRMGENQGKACSRYMTSKWFDWTEAQRQEYRKAFTDTQLAKVIQAHFLDIPAKYGFLDRMTTWVGKPASGTMLVISLQDKQRLLLDDKEIVLAKGDVIGFHLSVVHEIKPSATGQKWACLMTRSPYDGM